MRYIVSLVLTLVMGVGAFADSKDDIRAFVRSQAPQALSTDKDIKEFARYQRERQRTYAEAVDQHSKTKQVIIVWVGFTDGDELFQRWQQTKDLGYHVFVKDFDGVYTGVVVGRDFSGTFGRLATITSDYVAKITEQATAKFQPTVAPTATQCVGGSCGIPTSQFQYYGSGSSCANGKCPTR